MKPVKIDDEEDESADEELPQVNEDIEVKHMKRLEQLRARRPFGSVSEDGSGWVSVSSTSNNVISDLSPPRKRLGRNDSPSPEPQLNPSIPATYYLSPPRKPRARNDTPSPERGPKHPSTQEDDLSPPLKRSAKNETQRTRIHTPSPEPQLKPSISKDADMSPPWKRRVRNDTPELEMKSLSTRDSDSSPPCRRRAQNDTPESDMKSLSSRAVDISPPRRQPKSGPSADLSPPRRRQKHRQSLPDTSDFSPPRRGSRAQGGPKSKKKKEEKEKAKEIKLEWGKGLAQKREMEARLQELESEKDKPFARSRDDPELDTVLKERVRWGDPMAHLVKKKQFDPILPDFGANEKMKESGFIIPQGTPSHRYEKELFKRMNEKQATEREAYLWSVSDM
ncbi:unnamed protein product [Withania somnifera]